jgi:hypothetical protein
MTNLQMISNTDASTGAVTDGSIESENYPFWNVSKGGSVKIVTPLLLKFLEDNGFCLYQSQEGRNGAKQLIRNNEGVLELYDSTSVQKWVSEYIRKDRELPETDQLDVLDKWQRTNPASIKNLANQLKVVSEIGFKDTDRISIFRDDDVSCCIPFDNGVVKITKDDVSLIDRAELGDKGCIWETSLRRHCITVVDERQRNRQSVFRNFVYYALKSGVEPKVEGNCPELGTDAYTGENERSFW